MRVVAAYRDLLRNRPLARLLGGEFVSAIGDWLYIVALLVVIYTETGDPLLLGIFGAVRSIPYIVLSVPAGIVADRVDRRLILFVTDLARAACMLGMAVVLAVDGPLVVLAALAVLAACFSTFFYPAIGAYVPNLVENERQLGPANSAWASLDNLGFVVGPVLGGVLVAAGGTNLAFLINALTFLVIAAILWGLRHELERAVEKLKRVRDEVAASLKVEGSVLAPRHVLTAVAALRPTSVDDLGSVPAMREWQIDLLGAKFVAAMK